MAETNRFDVMSELLYERGWSRVLAPAGTAALAAIASEGPATPVAVSAAIGSRLDGPAWDPREPWTAAKARGRRGEFEAPDETHAGECADRSGIAAGHQPPLESDDEETVADALTFMVECGVLSSIDGLLDLNPSAPAPSEILPFDPHELGGRSRGRQ